MSGEEQHNSNQDRAVEKLHKISNGGHNANRGTWNRMRNTPTGGGTLRRGDNRLDKLRNDGPDRAQHQRPNLGAQTDKLRPNGSDNPNASNNKNDIGSQNLRKSLSNRASNLLKRKKKKNDPESSKNDESNTGDNNKTEDNKNPSESKSAKEEMKIIRKRMKIIKVVFIGLALFSFMFIVLLIAQILTGGAALTSTPFDSLTNYGTNDFHSITDDDNPYHNDEIDFYKKLQEVDEEYGGSVNINYVSALLMNLYYEHDFEQEDTELLEKTGGFDFAKMTGFVDSFAKIINDIGSTDYEINGPIFEALKTNDEIKDYYKDVVKTTTIDEILKRVFEMGAEIDKNKYVDEAVITSEIVVEVSTDGEKPRNITINEYIADSIYANASTLSNSEVVKAYTIGYSTNLAAKNKKLSIDYSTVSASNEMCSVNDGCSYNKDGNLVSGGGDQSSKNTLFYRGDYYYKGPLSDSEKTNLNNNINAVFGNVLVNSSGAYPELDMGKLNGLGGGDYKSILSSAYGDLTYKNIGEDSYILDGSYGSTKVQTSVTFYDQNDYGGYTFCGKKNETIKSSGCGVTSMAIIVSTYEKNPQYNPVNMMNAAYSTGYCGGGIVGTSPGFFKKEANTMKYKYYYASKYSKKDLNLVLKHLSQGDLVIAHMGPGHFTSGGHYMVLGGVDPETKKVYVYDPYNKVNSSYRKTGNGWYSFNDMIVKEAKAFYVVWKG